MTRQNYNSNAARLLAGMIRFTGLAVLTAGVLAGGAASAQGRNPGRGGGGGGSDRGSDRGSERSSPQRSDPSPSRSDYSPQRSEPSRSRDDYRPQRSDPSPQRSEPSPQRSDPSPSRDYSPSRNTDTPRTPTRDVNPVTPSRRDDSSSPQRDNSPSRNNDTPRTPTRDVNPVTPRRDDSSTSPNRDNSPAPRRDYNPGQRDGNSPRSLPRDSDRRVDPPTRSETNPTRDARPNDGRPSDQGAGNIFNRRNPGNRSEDNRPDNIRTDRRDASTRSESPSGRIRTPGPATTRAESVAPSRDRARDIFTRSQEGRYYNNGVLLRRGYYAPYREVRHYYPSYVYYPYYYPTFDISVSFFSPYSYYYGVCAPYIYRRHTYYYYPSTVYIEVPVYVGNDYRGWSDGRGADDYYLNQSSYYYDAEATKDQSLKDAVDDIRDGFRMGSIEHLVNLVDSQVKVAVFLKGKYEYSLQPNDYLDMTRDAMSNMETIEFDITRLRKRALGVFVASGKHIYRNKDGQKRTVYVSFVLEKLKDRWTITQIGTSPDKIQEP